MQALSRTFIFLGILLVASVLASIAASVISATLFGEAFSIAPGQAMYTDDGVWWRLHLPEFDRPSRRLRWGYWVAHKSGMAGFLWACRDPPLGAVQCPWCLPCGHRGLALLAAGWWNGSRRGLEAVFLPLEQMIGADHVPRLRRRCAPRGGHPECGRPACHL